MRTRVTVPRRQLEGEFCAGTSLHEAVRAMGHVIDYACGGQALCGTCRVRILAGGGHLTAPEAEEASSLAGQALGPGWRLACCARITPGPGRVTIECD